MFQSSGIYLTNSSVAIFQFPQFHIIGLVHNIQLYVQLVSKVQSVVDHQLATNGFPSASTLQLNGSINGIVTLALLETVE